MRGGRDKRVGLQAVRQDQRGRRAELEGRRHHSGDPENRGVDREQPEQPDQLTAG